MQDITAIGKFIYLNLCLLCSFFFGNITQYIIVLITVVIIDFITGIFKAWKNKNLSAKICREGIIKKVILFLIVGLVNVIEINLLQTAPILKNTICMFYIGSECLSILENISEYSNYPAWVKKIFVHLKNIGETDNTDFTDDKK